MTNSHRMVECAHDLSELQVGKEVRAMREELREKEARLFQSLKEALEKSKPLARNCLA